MARVAATKLNPDHEAKSRAGTPRRNSADNGWKCQDKLEQELRARGFRNIAGADEVGRGSLFGAVVAAAVILGA